MAVWEKFEFDCTNYLNDKFGEYATFTRKGGSDSTVPDIKVKTKSGKVFYIDVKHCPAQCGQFVLLPNLATRSFEYSRSNATSENRFAKMIMEYMDDSFEEFKEAGTSGKDIIMPNGTSIFADWIIHTYKNKGAEYFITNNYTIVPIERFLDFFTVTAKYRIKRSGSSSVGKSNLAAVSRHIQNGGYGVIGMRTDDSKLFVTSARNIHNTRFIINGTEYMFSERGSEYEIRKLSNTFNANVIFSIELKTSRGSVTDADFIRLLK